MSEDTFLEKVTERKAAVIKHSKKFQKYFGFHLCDYMHLIFGFDLLRFDFNIKTPDGTSTRDWIMKNQGKEAVKLIEKLIAL